MECIRLIAGASAARMLAVKHNQHMAALLP
jgi:hypothetical protein